MSGTITTTLAGQAACLSAALLWAIAVALFGRPIATYGARTVNTAKCALGAFLQGLTVLVLGQAGAVVGAPPGALGLIVASAIVGLVVGDTALFGAVARIGGHRTLLLQTLAPVFAAAVAFAWRGERLAGTQAAGAVVVLLGIALVVAPPRRGPAPSLPGSVPAGPRGSRRAITGVALGTLAACGQGTGIVLAKAGMTGIPVLPASALRLATAAVGLLLLESVSGRLGRIAALISDRDNLVRAVPATLLGTYVALFLMMAGVALAPAAVAAVLLATSPIFSLVLESIAERRLPSARGLAGTLLAVAGVGLLAAP
jgi:drug/metabolite transporter (DMT)-like permease